MANNEIQAARQSVNAAHRPDFSVQPFTGCTCGLKTVKTYAGWKRHAAAQMRKVDPTGQRGILPMD